MSALLGLVGCTVFLTHDPKETADSGWTSSTPEGQGASCAGDWDCIDDLRCNGAVCTSGCIADDECTDGFACGLPGHDRTGPDGCFERCEDDEDCTGGYRCDYAYGDCYSG